MTRVEEKLIKFLALNRVLVIPLLMKQSIEHTLIKKLTDIN